MCPVEVPGAVLRVAGDAWSADTEGLSGQIWRADGCYVKRAATDEHARLRWLGSRFEVPAVLAFEDGWLVLQDVGAPSLAAVEPVRAGTVLGTVLRELHSVPWQECPFDSRVAVAVEKARHNVEAGLVDPDDFDDEHLGTSPEELFEKLVAAAPADEDLVVVHGDFCPPNVLVRPDGSTVVIDVGRLGVADRHHDLALVHRELGEEAAAAFDRAYGLVPDPAKLYWYRLLDEFF
ncbi:hypothetical protein BBK82_29490 [Lentzea guizhouensis]|uniref:Aminoglycoside phosphotransferase domain-containing protein n=1 Tax=Lentzea guizhouensis TaxID=1586287 RepID=A0A1B2HPD3_9PSEU|nr:hypothetical protein BBK82_29490 [Lentzea guizhouensis]